MSLIVLNSAGLLRHCKIEANEDFSTDQMFALLWAIAKYKPDLYVVVQGKNRQATKRNLASYKVKTKSIT